MDTTFLMFMQVMLFYMILLNLFGQMMLGVCLAMKAVMQLREALLMLILVHLQQLLNQKLQA